MGIILAIAFLVLFFVYRMHRRQRLLQPQKAMGVILSVEQQLLRDGHRAEIKLLVMVMPEHSRNFVGELVETVLLTDLLSLKIGDKISLTYADPGNLVRVG